MPTSFVPQTRGPATSVRGFTIFTPAAHQQGILVVSGTTTDATGVGVSAVTVDLYDAVSDTLIATTVSDINGTYRFVVDSGVQQFFLRGYKPVTGNINLFGTTDVVVATLA